MTVPTGLPEVQAILQGRDDEGQPVFSVLVKRTYELRPGGRLVRAESARPLVPIDQYYEDGDPEWAAVKHESDLAPFKVATDVVVIGKAFAPNRRPVPQLDVTVEVAAHRKTVRVTGDRHCFYRGSALPGFSDPVPFIEMPIRYDRAYGGQDSRSHPEEPFRYPRNHLGVGAVLKNTKDSVDGLPLPNIEDPEDLLTPERLVFDQPERWG